MPTLDWIGKQAVVGHHRRVPSRLLHCDRALSAGDPDAGNLLVQGDNLEALKALLPYYAGQVKCIYIDPPYNTGNEGWVYNDNVNSPEIRRWLGEVVGKEAEDLSRHDKWLCMMYPRLRLLKEFLSEDGILCISLDDTELGRLRLVMDEIFGVNCFIGSIAWNTRNTDNRVKTQLSPDHEYILVYGKRSDAAILGRVIERDYKNPDNDPRGPYVTDPLTGKATRSERPNLHAYSMEQPGTKNVWHPDPAKGWITDEAGYRQLLAANRIWWPPNPKTGKPRKKRFLSETKERMPASSWWPEFRAQSGAKQVGDILGERVFAFPKPIDVVTKIIDHSAPPTCFVLDSFAGTGTSGHAVLAKNAEDGGHRRFILVEIDEQVASSVTAPRLRAAIEGYGETPGLGSGFRFCRLGKPLFDEHGSIAEEVSFTDLAAHVFFTETGSPIPKRARKDNPLVGSFDGRAIYLLYNGVLGDRRPESGNVLTHAVAQELPPHPDGAGPRIVFGEACRLGAGSTSRCHRGVSSPTSSANSTTVELLWWSTRERCLPKRRASSTRKPSVNSGQASLMGMACSLGWLTRTGTNSLAAWHPWPNDPLASGSTRGSDRFREHVYARELLRIGVAEGVVRASYGGVPCQARIDWVNPVDGRGIVDLKSCDDLDRFEADAERFGYAHQLAFYRELVVEAAGVELECHLVAVEKREPYRCGVWQLSRRLVDQAADENADAIERLKRCRETDVWPTGFESMRLMDTTA